MLTSRGLWFLMAVLVLLTLGLWTGTPAVVLTSLTVLFWFLGAWLLFVVRVRLLEGRLRVARRLSDETGPVQSLWAGRSARVTVRLRSDSPLPSPYVVAADRVPYGVGGVTGNAWAEGHVREGEHLELEYGFTAPAAGTLRFEGVAVQVADAQGLFYHALFLPAPRTCRVLPPLADARGHMPAVKRHNVLPLLGAHRHKRPGSGSELLDLRDYLPGDPPRTVAWKVSARRDRLITKVFESEVPVRCTFFLDTSQSVRVGGPGNNALARLVEITSAVAQASSAARDLTGLCVFDEGGVRRLVRPARGSRHLVRLLGELADVGRLAPESADLPVDSLLPLAYGLAREVYPHLLHPDVNSFPGWLPWLSPRPAYTLRLPPVRARSWAGLPAAWLSRLAWRAGLRVRQAVVGRVSGRERRRYRWRKQLAAILSVRHGMGPGGLALLLEDDERLAVAMQRFLGEHNVPYSLPFYDAEGRYLFAAPEKVGVLASTLLHAVARGRDNELFVLVADLLEIEEHLGPLLRAVKVALARHHQVMVVCPWPPGVPLPGKDGEARGDGRKKPGPLSSLIDRATAARFHHAYHEVRRAFGRLGVTAVCAREGDPVRLVLDRMERLRGQLRGVR